MGYEFVMRQKLDSDEIITDDYLEHANTEFAQANYIFNNVDIPGNRTYYNPNHMITVYFRLNRTVPSIGGQGNVSNGMFNVRISFSDAKRLSVADVKKRLNDMINQVAKDNSYLQKYGIPSNDQMNAATYAVKDLVNGMKEFDSSNNGKHNSLKHAQHEGYWSPNLGKVQTSAKPEFPWKLGKCYLKNYGGQIVMCAPLTTLNKKAHANYASIEFNLNAYGNDTAAKAIEDGARKFKQISGYTLPADMKPDLIRQAISLYYKYQDKPQHEGYYSPNLSHSVAIDSSMWAVVPKGEELAHYGVKGMKWGVRRYQNPDGSLTAAGREHYGKGGTKEVKNEGVGAALALYAAITLGPYAVLSAMAAGLSAAEAHKEKKREKKAEAELFGEGKDYGLTMDDIKKVNPHYSEGDRNYKINCPKCSTVVELRKRGMNVSANSGSGQTDKEMAAWFKGAKPKENLHVDAAKETILSFPAGSSGFISGKYNYMGGHVVHWTNIGNNTIRIEDGQVGKVYTWDQFKETYHFQIDRYTVTRLDNCKINEKLMKDQAVFIEYKEEKK